MTACCDNFTPCLEWPHCSGECSGCANCMGHPDDHQTAPAVDSDDGPEQSGAPLPPQGAPLQNASPVAPAALDATGLATELVWQPDTYGWNRAIELSAHVARLSALLEWMLADLDSEGTVGPSTRAHARDAIAKAREATA